MESISVILSLLLSLMGIGVATFAFNFLRKVKERPKKGMASFQLRPEKTLFEFKLIYYGFIIEFFAFLIYGIGGLLEVTVLLNIARVISIGFILVAIKIAHNWWRQFK